MCPLCLEWFLPPPRQQDCILEYILPTKSKRAKFEFLLEKKLAITCQARVLESGFGRGFPKVPEERLFSLLPLA
ncbi:MAG: hypothetical protein BEV12_18045 [Microcystis aeruginosa CACIAM 03]|nr:MAG: hypothetical protein BEV12_18045 [Microcystis aeruginosa CACIAM 03]